MHKFDNLPFWKKASGSFRAGSSECKGSFRRVRSQKQQPGLFISARLATQTVHSPQTSSSVILPINYCYSAFCQWTLFTVVHLQSQENLFIQPYILMF